MAEKRIEEIREILAQAAARDEELVHTLEVLAVDLMKDFAGDDTPPVWAEIKAEKGERQVTEHFVMQDKWLRGDLVFDVTPEHKLVMKLRMITTRDKTHEVGLMDEPSKSLVIDPKDEKHRADARKRFFDSIFAHIEGQIRKELSFPVE